MTVSYTHLDVYKRQPYIKLFTEQKASSKNLWLNENVAGSYAPSSLRPDQPFRQVVNISGRKYSLPTNHAQLAFEHQMCIRDSISNV